MQNNIHDNSDTGYLVFRLRREMRTFANIQEQPALAITYSKPIDGKEENKHPLHQKFMDMDISAKNQQKKGKLVYCRKRRT